MPLIIKTNEPPSIQDTRAFTDCRSSDEIERQTRMDAVLKI